jgi:hypothetical protein
MSIRADPATGSTAVNAAPEQYFGTHPVQIRSGWNSIPHVLEDERRGCRPVSHRELADFFLCRDEPCACHPPAPQRCACGGKGRGDVQVPVRLGFS